MLVEPENLVVSVVLVGSFNPAIFNPDWFSRLGLLTESEAADAEIQIIHPRIARFRADWLNLSVETDRLIATTSIAPYVRLQDLISRTFLEFLSHTPIHQLGINLDAHIRVGMKERDNIGFALAPVTPWGEWADDIMLGALGGHGGVQSITMQQRQVANRPFDQIQTTVQPSLIVQNNEGIFIQVNDHYQVSEESKSTGSVEAMVLLEEHFEESIQRSQWIMDQVLKLR